MSRENLLKFRNPRTPVTNKGYMIIESDDNNSGDYTHWFPLVNKIKNEASQWMGTGFLSLGLNINTGTLAQSGKLTVAQVQKIESAGWEIINHGMYHVGIGRHYLQTAVAPGSAEIFLDNTYYFGHGVYILQGLYKYEIISEDGKTKELVEVSSYTSSTNKSNSVKLKNPIQNSFGANSYFQMSQESMVDLIENSREILENYGFKIENFSPPYHSGSYFSKNEAYLSFVNGLYKSARGIPTGINSLDSIVWNNLKCEGFRSTTTKANIDSWLDQTTNTNGLLIVFGHGETEVWAMENLEYMVRGALSRGIKMINRSRAVDLFKK